MHPEDKFAHNWLIKKVVNDQVKQNLHLITGIVYDLGCGTRPYETDILGAGNKYVGVDWSSSIHGCHCDLIADLNEPLPIASNSADTVVSFEVLEHLREPQVMLDEAHRILRKGGSVLLSVPFQWWVHEAPWDFYRYTRFGLEYMFHKSGFVEVTICETTGFWEMWILKLNYQSARLIRGATPVRFAVRALLIPFWFIGQKVAPLISRHWASPNETAGYFVVAKKP